MKEFLKYLISILLITFVFFFFFDPNPYLRTSLIHLTADLDDYKIFENRTVAAGEYIKWGTSNNYNSYNLQKTELDTFNQFETISYLIIKDSTILFENYWDNYNSDSLTNSFSMAKSINSLLIGIAIDENKITSVNDKVSKYLPEFKDGDRKDITIKNLLTMSSGLTWNESYWNPFSSTTNAYYGNNLENLVLDLKLKEKPGENYKYLSANTQLLSLILKKATGKNLSTYASEKLWKPLNAKHDALWSIDKKNGVEKAYCCFNSNARDFARLGQLILNNGKWNGEQIISEDYLSQALQAANYLKDENNKNVDFYGYQWWLINCKGYDIQYARGILGQYIIVIPEKNTVVVRLGHKRSKERTRHHPNDVLFYINTALEIIK
ncbi:MAG: serine hydrolase [Bacteroidota bacterium]|nr:serine hydrolase [Bacteroidota bacterium]